MGDGVPSVENIGIFGVLLVLVVKVVLEWITAYRKESSNKNGNGNGNGINGRAWKIDEIHGFVTHDLVPLTKEMYMLHNVRDADGIPRWYNSQTERRTKELKLVIANLDESVRRNTEAIERLERIVLKCSGPNVQQSKEKGS